jgi:carboxypeptidase Q
MNRRTAPSRPGLLAAACSPAPRRPPAPGNDPAALAKIRDAALQSDYAWERLEDMTDLIGPRLSGSPARRRP